VLLVRSRVNGDIERVFPHATIRETRKADYRFRAVLSREEVVRSIAREVSKISYRNFKDSVKEKDRHDASMKCWSSMYRLQEDRLKKSLECLDKKRSLCA
jgi:hypothetical protein